MTDSDGDEGEAEPKLCDLCVAMVVDSTELYAGVPDSLSIHAVDPKLDGKRIAVGCSREHLAERSRTADVGRSSRQIRGARSPVFSNSILGESVKTTCPGKLV